MTEERMTEERKAAVARAVREAMLACGVPEPGGVDGYGIEEDDDDGKIENG